MYLIVFVYIFPQATRLSIKKFMDPRLSVTRLPGFWLYLKLAACLCLQPSCFIRKTFRCTLSPPFFYFFEPIDFFRKKSPNQVQQALDPGFLLPFSGQRSTLYINKKSPN